MRKIINNENQKMTQDKRVVQGMLSKFFEIIHKYIEKNLRRYDEVIRSLAEVKG